MIRRSSVGRRAAVLAEACHLLRATSTACAPVLALVEQGLVAVPCRFAKHASYVARLMARYCGLPLSLADACLIRICATGRAASWSPWTPTFARCGRATVEGCQR